jgi:hypothetical protein
MTGNWPFRSSVPPSAAQDINDYRDEVDSLFKKGIFPDLSGVQGADVISGCWEYRYKNAADVLEDLRARH